jgi:hypothetical protein
MAILDLFTFVFVNYIRKHFDEPNSMATFEDITFEADQHQGHIQLKWWKTQGHLFIQGVSVEPQGDNLLTPSVKSLLNRRDMQEMGLQMVILQCIHYPELIQKLLERGWQRRPYDPYSLYLVCDA